MDAIHQAERELTAYAMQRLPEVKGLRILGPAAEKRGGLVAFTLEAAHPHDIAAVLDDLGIAIRAGPSLRPAAPRTLPHPGQRPRQLLPVQHQGRSGPAGEGAAQSGGDVYVLTWLIKRSVCLAASHVPGHPGPGRQHGPIRRRNSRSLQTPAALRAPRRPDAGLSRSQPALRRRDQLELKIEDGKIADVAFTGHGCAVSRAAASMMSEEIIGKSLDELRGWDKENITRPARHRGRPGADQVRPAAAQGDEGGGVGVGGRRVDE